MNNLFHLKIIDVTIRKVNKYLCGIRSSSKVVHRKGQEVFVGEEFIVLSDCSGMQKCFESEANLPQVVKRWRTGLLQY